jgi:hypothetical protein
MRPRGKLNLAARRGGGRAGKPTRQPSATGTNAGPKDSPCNSRCKTCNFSPNGVFIYTSRQQGAANFQKIEDRRASSKRSGGTSFGNKGPHMGPFSVPHPRLDLSRKATTRTRISKTNGTAIAGRIRNSSRGNRPVSSHLSITSSRRARSIAIPSAVERAKMKL